MATINTPEFRPVYRALHRPLTIAGVERRLFFLALLVGAAAFNLFYSFLAGCLLFAGLYVAGRWATGVDPQMLAILARAGRGARRYDAAKRWRPSAGGRR
jgi:type IV secretory pathway TrbD component